MRSPRAVRLVDISSSKISKSKNPSGRSCTWTRVWSFAAAIIVAAPSPPPISSRKGGGWRWGAGGGARFSPLRGPMAWCRGLLNVPCRIDPYDSLGDGEEKEARLALTQQRSWVRPIAAPHGQSIVSPCEGARCPHHGFGCLPFSNKKKKVYLVYIFGLGSISFFSFQ